MKGGDLDKETGTEVGEEKATRTPLGDIWHTFCLALVVTTQEDRNQAPSVSAVAVVNDGEI